MWFTVVFIMVVYYCMYSFIRNACEYEKAGWLFSYNSTKPRQGLDKNSPVLIQNTQVNGTSRLFHTYLESNFVV